jgi:hypothetical protein
MLNRPRRSLPAVLAFPMTMIVSSVLVSGCGADKLSDDAYGFIDLAPWYYDGSSAATPSAGLPKEIGTTRGWVNGARAEYYDFGLVGVTKKRSDGKLPDYASIPAMYFFFNGAGTPLFSKPIYEERTGLWHMRGGVAALNPNPAGGKPKNVPYSVRIRNVMGDFQRPIIDRLQHNTDYSGLWEIWEVTAPDDYQPDAIKNYATLKKGIDNGTFGVHRTQKVINCPVLDDRQYVVPTAMYYGVPHPRIELWYRTKQGSCFLADGWFALGDASGKLHNAGNDSRRLQMFDVISYTIGSGAGARTTLTAPVSKMFIPTAKVATLDSRGTSDVRYTSDNVTEALPRMNPGDPPGYRPIRWLWDLNVPQDPPYVAATYRSTAQMDPAQMANRLTANTPFTKNFPLIGTYASCTNNDDCMNVGHAPGINLECYGLAVSNGATAFIMEPGGKHCDVPLVRFGEFCGPAKSLCGGFNPKNADPNAMPPPPVPPTADESAVWALNQMQKGTIQGGYTCQPNASTGGYCFLSCDTTAPGGVKPMAGWPKVSLKYQGPDGQMKTDTADVETDPRCGNIPGYKCLNPSGSGVPNTARVCLRGCDSGRPDTFNDVFCRQATAVMINEKVNGDFQKGMTCSTRGLSGAAGCQWDPAYEPRDPKSNFIPQ